MDARRTAPGKSIEYPTGDNQPIGETDEHRDEMKEFALNVLKEYFRGQPLVYVSGNNFLYLTEVDLGEKMAKYRDDLGVEEYFLFDLRGEWIRERLRGYVLDGGIYRPVTANAAGRLSSRSLGLELQEADRHVRFYVPGTEYPLPTREELAARQREAAERERLRAEAAEAEVQRLRAELERLRTRVQGNR